MFWQTQTVVILRRYRRVPQTFKNCSETAFFSAKSSLPTGPQHLFLGSALITVKPASLENNWVKFNRTQVFSLPALSVSHSISAHVEFCSNYICQSSCMNLSKNDEWKFSHGFVKIDICGFVKVVMRKFDTADNLTPRTI